MCLSRLIRQVLRSSQPFAARASLSKVLWRPHLSSPRRCLRINPGCLQVLQWLLPGWFFCANGDKIVAQLERASVQRSEEHTSELQSLMRISYAVFCLKKKKNKL